MRKVLKWVGIGVGGLLGLVLLALLVAFGIGHFRLSRTYEIDVAPVVIPTDAEAIERGAHLATTWAACSECHGDRLEGQVLSDDIFGRLSAPNLTSGEDGVGTFYNDQDWVRAIRHGVKPNGRPILFIPDFHRLGDEDLGAIIAYVKSVPAVDNQVPDTLVRPLGKAFIGAGPLVEIPPLAAEVIDHEAPFPPSPAPGTAAYGELIASVTCMLCHGENLAGFVQGFSEGDPAPRNLTPAGNLASWTEEDFFTAMRSGVTPSGEVLDGEAMPWPLFSTLTDEEISSLWLFLQTLPPAQPEG